MGAFAEISGSFSCILRATHEPIEGYSSTSDSRSVHPLALSRLVNTTAAPAAARRFVDSRPSPVSPPVVTTSLPSIDIEWGAGLYTLE